LAFGETNHNVAGDFIPIPQLHRTDATVVLYFLAKSAIYLEPVNDPWFLALVQYVDEIDNTSYYLSEDPVAVLGCAYQFEICNAGTVNGRKCFNSDMENTNLEEQLDGVGFNARQAAIAKRILTSARIGSVYSLILTEGASDLLANRQNVDGVSTSLPPDQWVLEADHMFGTSLNNLQILSAQYVTGPTAPSVGGTIVDLPDEDKWMCTNQIVRRDDYTSFSVLGLAIIFVIGGCLIILNLTLISMVDRLQKSTESGQRRNEEWQASDTLQLHRVALENQGVDQWEGIDASVPVTTYSNSIMLPLRKTSDLSHKTHPIDTGPVLFTRDSDVLDHSSLSPFWKEPMENSKDLLSNSSRGDENVALMSPTIH
jgi:hypothetical protein